MNLGDGTTGDGRFFEAPKVLFQSLAQSFFHGLNRLPLGQGGAVVLKSTQRIGEPRRKKIISG